MRFLILAFVAFVFTLAQAEQFHPMDEMDYQECYAEYGTNCEEAEEYEQEEYDYEQEQEQEEQEEQEEQDDIPS